jgi:hypothetical protein
VGAQEREQAEEEQRNEKAPEPAGVVARIACELRRRLAAVAGAPRARRIAAVPATTPRLKSPPRNAGRMTCSTIRFEVASVSSPSKP